MGIEFHALRKSFGTRTVLDGVDLSIARGSVQFIIGTSGTGKSVLMKHVVGLVRADAGRVVLDDEDITSLSERELMRVRRKCQMVFQHSTLFDDRTLLDNVALPLEKRGACNAAAARELAHHALSRLHLDGFAARLPSEVGAGVRKRAAIARALALEPSYVVYDEPTTGLDPVAARRVDRLIRQVAETAAATTTQVVVSHDLRSVFDVADRVALLYGGRVRFLGTPSELRASRDPVVVQFIGGLAEGPIEMR